jgi:integrase
MARGDGRLFQRKGCRTWSFSLYLPDKNGRSRERVFSTGKTRRGEALAVYLQKRADRDRAKFTGTRLIIDAERVTADQLFEIVESHYRMGGRSGRPGGIKSLYETLQHVKPIREYFRGWKALSISAEAVRDYIVKRRAEGKAEATIENEISILRQAFKLAVKEKAIGEAPDLPRLQPRKRNKRRVRLSAQEVADFLAWADREDRDGYDYFAFAFLSGLRPKTIRSFEVRHLDRNEWILAIEEEIDKNEYDRGLAVEGRDREIIEGRLARNDSCCPYLFQRKGRRLTEDWTRKFFYQGCAAIGITIGRKNGGKTPYDLKKSSARAWSRSGVPEHLRMVATGHKTSATFRDYDYQEVEDQRAAKRMRDTFLDETMPSPRPLAPIAHIPRTNS